MAIINYDAWHEWNETIGCEIENRHKEIVSAKDNDLIKNNLICYADEDEIYEDMMERGQNWHSGGACMESTFSFADLSEESKIGLRNRFYDMVEYNLEYRKFFDDDEKWISHDIPERGIRDNDLVSIRWDLEWGIFMSIKSPNGEEILTMKPDDDPVIKSFWDINRRTLPKYTAK